MDFGDTVNSVAGQFRVIWNAPVPFFVVIAVFTLAIWRAMEWRYAGTIARLKDECEGLSKKPKPAVSIRLVDPESDPSAKALRALKEARDNVAVALHQGNYHSHRRAFHEAEAAMLSIKRQFGIEPMKIPDETAAETPYKLLLEAYISFIDRFYPLLRDGHVEEARERRNAFKCSWGQA